MMTSNERVRAVQERRRSNAAGTHDNRRPRDADRRDAINDQENRMPTYNVTTPVVALIEADNEEAAQLKLETMLDQAGFDVYPGGTHDAFLSDDQGD